MTRSLLVAAFSVVAATAPAAQAPLDCEDAAVTLSPYRGRLTDAELAFGVAWLQDQIDLRPEGYDPCVLGSGMAAAADSLLADRGAGGSARAADTAEAATEAPVGTSADAVASRVHGVPAGNGTHRIELLFGAPTAGTYSARVTAAPAWLQIRPARVEVEAGQDRRVAVPFELRPDAPVGATGTVVVQVEGDRGTAGLATFSVRVDPPTEIAFGVPYPNPAAGAVTLRYSLPTDASVTIEVIDVLGRSAARLDVGERAAGAHEIALDSRALAVGTYVVRMTVEGGAGRDVRVRRLTVVR